MAQDQITLGLQSVSVRRPLEGFERRWSLDQLIRNPLQIFHISLIIIFLAMSILVTVGFNGGMGSWILTTAVLAWVLTTAITVVCLTSIIRSDRKGIGAVTVSSGIFSLMFWFALFQAWNTFGVGTIILSLAVWLSLLFPLVFLQTALRQGLDRLDLEVTEDQNRIITDRLAPLGFTERADGTFQKALSSPHMSEVVRFTAASKSTFWIEIFLQHRRGQIPYPGSEDLTLRRHPEVFVFLPVSPANPSEVPDVRVRVFGFHA